MSAKRWKPVTITSSCEGLLVPPGHNMVIYTMSAGGVSVGAVLLITVIPGIAMFLPDLLGN
ncbi:MAG: TRAP transporter large permease subunit [Lachnospiraceae bacterium]|nr:TRAP transporter large permease subunit [Lachnospiraceae bacterium]